MVQVHVRSIAHIEIDEVVCPSFAHQSCHSTVEGHWVGQALFPLDEALTVSNNLILLCTLTYLSRGSAPQSFHNLHRHEAHWRMVPRFSFLPFKKMEVIFPFLQSLGTLPDCYDFLNMMESDLGTSSEVPYQYESLQAQCLL